MFIIDFNKNADLFVKRHLWNMHSRNTCNTRCINAIHRIYEETIICAKPFDTFLNRNSGIDCGIIKILIRIFEVSFSKLIDMFYKLDSEEGVNMLKRHMRN